MANIGNGRNMTSRNDHRLKTEQLERRILLTTNFVPGPVNVVSTIPDLDYVTSASSIDLDGDADLDRLVAEINEISWFESSPGLEPVRRLIASDPNRSFRSVVADDFDNDGDIDVAATWSSTDHDSGGIEWFENIDGHSFAEQGVSLFTQATNTGNVSVAASDLDGDGDTDLVASFQTSGKLFWFENDSTASFVTHTIATETEGAYRIRIADLDTDGDLDIAVTTNLAGRLDWYENNGTMQFTKHLISNDLYQVREMTIGDVDNDGDLDVLAAEQQHLALFRNDGNQQFKRDEFSVAYDITPHVSDLDRDGDNDILTIGRGGAVDWYENIGSNEYEVHPVAGVGRNPATVLVDTPGRNVELTIASYSALSSSALSRYVLSAYEFTASSLRPLGSASGTKDYDQLDMDGDGDQDILGPWSWYKNEDVDNWPRIHHGFSNTAAAASDINRDGHTDFFVGRYDGEIAWYENRRRGEFSRRHIGYLAGTIANVQAADANGDGDVDFLASTSLGHIVWRINDGQQVFETEVLVATDEMNFSSVRGVDINSDRKADVISLATDGELVLHVAQSSGEYVPQVLAIDIGESANVQTIDFDSDGDIDIVTSRQDSVVWFENKGTDTPEFLERIVVEVTGRLSSFLPHDVDDDGDVDVIYSSTAGTFHLDNLGSLEFQSNNISPGIFELFLPNDVDQDGDTDILTFATWGLGWIRHDDSIHELDFDEDGNHDCADIATLQRSASDGAYQPSHDLNQDNRVDQLDVDEWLTHAAKNEFDSNKPFTRGDLNLDGKVGAQDLNTLAKNWDMNVDGGWCDGDFDFDGRVDSIDLNRVGQNWLSSIHSANAIPTTKDIAKATLQQVPQNPDSEHKRMDHSSSNPITNNATIRRRETARVRRDLANAAQTFGMQERLVDEALGWLVGVHR